MEPTQKQLSEAFDRVKDPKHWKLPTKAITVDTKEEAELIVRAVIHFTGGVPFKQTLKSGKVKVHSSPGYFNIIGA